MAIEWQAIIAPAAVVSASVAIGALAYAIRNARKQAKKLAAQTETLSVQTELLRKQLLGEVYDEARVKHLQFLLPAKRQREIEGFKQKDEEETSSGKYIAIPVGSERELHICWEMAETQTLRGYRVRFEGNYRSKPEILGVEHAFTKKIFEAYGSDEYIDWNGDFHREYARQLRCPKGSYHYVTLRVRGVVEGRYSLHVRVRVDEAPKPFEGKLAVDCLTKPNDWAKQHWC
ncbi:MAG TPA: hypothetical protein G4O12_00450 [Dehalococcoidia bacterium]|nr:hypothetical protein [Dehalococcoidia bacterium]